MKETMSNSYAEMMDTVCLGEGSPEEIMKEIKACCAEMNYYNIQLSKHLLDIELNENNENYEKKYKSETLRTVGVICKLIAMLCIEVSARTDRLANREELTNEML